MKKGLLSVALITALTVSSVGAAEMAEGNLFDVTKGKEIRNIVFENTGVSGDAIAKWDKENSEFVLETQFQNLPTANSDDFYEGWLVQKTPFKFISTGKVVLDEEGNMVNNFNSNIDYSSYNFYVLTIEPNDGDPAPADHILEGTVPVIMKVNMTMNSNTAELKQDSMLDKDQMMKSESMMKKEELKANKYYLPIKTLLTKYSEDQLKKLQANIPKLKEVYENRTDISDSKKAKVLEVIDVIALVLEESMEMMMEK